MAIKGISDLKCLLIKQKKELAELFGYETRNKYAIETAEGQQVAFAAEQQKGFWGFLFRQWLGHWRSFEFKIFDAERQLILQASHPFRIFFQRLEISSPDGRLIGTAQRRFSILTKSFDIIDPTGQTLFSVRSPIWKIWTFPFKRNGNEMAVVKKKWSGLAKEVFTDADNFEVQYGQYPLSDDEKILILAAGLYIDLMFFENKAGR